MRLFPICLLAILALVAGCAGSHPSTPDVAPSQQVKSGLANGGWSVPPAEQAKLQAAAQAKQKAEREQAAAQAKQKAEREQAAAAAREPVVKPIVPAFPVRLRESRVPELRMVHFAFDKWSLSSQARAVLDADAHWLKANPQVNVQIGGHCDERGSPEYNMALGERRARRVRDYLIRHGVPAERLTAISYGEEVPLDPRHNEAAWAKNRRAEFQPIGNPQASRATTQNPAS